MAKRSSTFLNSFLSLLSGKTAIVEPATSNSLSSNFPLNIAVYDSLNASLSLLLVVIDMRKSDMEGTEVPGSLSNSSTVQSELNRWHSQFGAGASTTKLYRWP
ncbi:hypothetical protein BDQ17DRAFT_621417 [Cyathus striatus]|nr:hypothetical protein BDQ17DRAFT_621417 [Cyathus striatus]